MDNFKEEMAFQLFGRSRTLAIAGKACVSCGKLATDFRDVVSAREYGISGLCQCCQDKTFGVEDEPEVGQGSHAIPGFFIPPESI